MKIHKKDRKRDGNKHKNRFTNQHKRKKEGKIKREREKQKEKKEEISAPFSCLLDVFRLTEVNFSGVCFFCMCVY